MLHLTVFTGVIKDTVVAEDGIFYSSRCFRRIGIIL